MLGIEVLRQMQYGMQILEIAERRWKFLRAKVGNAARSSYGLCAFCSWAASTRAGHTSFAGAIPTNQFFITNFGAVGNGTSNSASAIQKAITAAAGAGGGTVVVAALSAS